MILLTLGVLAAAGWHAGCLTLRGIVHLGQGFGSSGTLTHIKVLPDVISNGRRGGEVMHL